MTKNLRLSFVVSFALMLFSFSMGARAGEVMRSEGGSKSAGRAGAQQLCLGISNPKEFSDCLEWRASEEARVNKFVAAECKKSEIYVDGVLQKKTAQDVEACLESNFPVGVFAKETKAAIDCGGWATRKSDRKKFDACLKSPK